MQENRIKIAKQLWGRWPPEARTERTRLLWLTTELNGKQSKAFPTIKINWVTRHLKEIAELDQIQQQKERT